MPETAPNYYANITSIDKYIGTVIDQLEEMEILDNTIIIFTADHGEMLGSHGLTAKNVLFTESIAVPFIVHWPQQVNGGINDVLFSSTDILPTLMGLSGMSKKIPKAVQGSDLSSFVLESETEAKGPEGLLLMLGNSRGILTERYTLVLKENKKPWDEKEGTRIEEAFIFDNVEDPYQFNKIPLEEEPELSRHLLQLLAKKLEFANDPWYKEKKYPNLIPYSKILSK